MKNQLVSGLWTVSEKTQYNLLYLTKIIIKKFREIKIIFFRQISAYYIDEAQDYFFSVKTLVVLHLGIIFYIQLRSGRLGEILYNMNRDCTIPKVK